MKLPLVLITEYSLVLRLDRIEDVGLLPERYQVIWGGFGFYLTPGGCCLV